MDYLKDSDFLIKLYKQPNIIYYTRIIVLDKNNFPITSIEGRVSAGGVNIDGASSVRRTCNITFVADAIKNDLTDIDNILSINKKIKIERGLLNEIDDRYDKIIWFPQGIFIINQPSISHNITGVTISLSCKDKMCLLNGECGGGLPSSITFHEYDQLIGSQAVSALPEQPNEYTIYNLGSEKYKWTVTKGWVKIKDSEDNSGSIVTIKQRIYDIILTLVANFGNEDISNILISDVPIQLKQLVRWVGTGSVYYNARTGVYTTNQLLITDDESNWKEFKFNDDIGYIYTDFIYPGELISNIGDNVCSVLDTICNALGNFEYFYDIEGHFVFKEKTNYLNNSYNEVTTYRLSNANKIEVDNETKFLALAANDLFILDDLNYQVDFNSNSKIIYEFNDGNNMVTSYSNSPNFMNIKNDYHIWGKNQDGFGIHYHLAFKKKPNIMNTYRIVEVQNEFGDYTGQVRLATEEEAGKPYVPNDWRAELYMQGLSKQFRHQRPDVYEQELLDLFDMIYDMREQKFKTDIVSSPNELIYFLDFVEPKTETMDYTVDAIGQKTYSYQYDKIIKLFNCNVPNNIILDIGAAPEERQSDIRRCELEGCPYSNIDSAIYSNIAIGTVGYSAEEKVRELLYQYTNYSETINIQTYPIYHLDVNTRIVVNDSASGIHGDYIVKSISLPLDSKSTMSISAIKALERV